MADFLKFVIGFKLQPLQYRTYCWLQNWYCPGSGVAYRRSYDAKFPRNEELHWLRQRASWVKVRTRYPFIGQMYLGPTNSAFIEPCHEFSHLNDSSLFTLVSCLQPRARELYQRMWQLQRDRAASQLREVLSTAPQPVAVNKTTAASCCKHYSSPVALNTTAARCCKIVNTTAARCCKHYISPLL